MPKTKVKFGYVWTKQRQAMYKSYMHRHQVWRECAYFDWVYSQSRAYKLWVRGFLRPEHEAKTTQRNRAGAQPPRGLSKSKDLIPARLSSTLRPISKIHHLDRGMER